MNNLVKKDIIHPELSYKLVGILFDVYNELGYGYQEKFYENALEIVFKEKQLKYQKQLYIPMKFKGQQIGSYFLDFLIEDKIVLELKQGERFSKTNIEQVYGYLKAKDLKLGLIAQFTPKGLKFKRIVNLN